MDGAFDAPEAGEYAFMLGAGTLPKSLAAGRHTVRVWRGVYDKPTLAWRKCGGETVVRVSWGSGVSPLEEIDYTVFVGTISENIAAYRKLTGGTAALPDWAFGYWHCRERFHSQRELLETAREFKRRGYPVSVIVQDWQWWRDKTWNSMEWDPKRFPDPKAMTDELHSLSMKFMLSVWSKTEGNTPFANEMRAAGGFVEEHGEAASRRLQQDDKRRGAASPWMTSPTPPRSPSIGNGWRRTSSRLAWTPGGSTRSTASGSTSATATRIATPTCSSSMKQPTAN